LGCFEKIDVKNNFVSKDNSFDLLGQKKRNGRHPVPFIENVKRV